MATRPRTRKIGRLSEIAQVAVRHGFGYFFERHKLTDLLPWTSRVEVDPAAPAAEELPDQSCFGTPGLSDQVAVVEVLRRIDTVTAAVVEAMSSGARRSSPAGRSGQS
jgi:hypothetical protein